MYPPTISKTRSANDLFNGAYAMFLFFFFFFNSFFLILFLKAYVVGTHLNCIDKSMQFKWVPTTFVCVEVLRPSQPNGVMSSAVSLPNHTFTGQA